MISEWERLVNKGTFNQDNKLLLGNHLLGNHLLG